MEQTSVALKRGAIIRTAGDRDRVVITDALHYNDYITLRVFDKDVVCYPCVGLNVSDFVPPLVIANQKTKSHDNANAKQEKEEENETEKQDGGLIKKVGLCAVLIARGGVVNGTQPRLLDHSVDPSVIDILCGKLFELMNQIGYVSFLNNSFKPTTPRNYDKDHGRIILVDYWNANKSAFEKRPCVQVCRTYVLHIMFISL